MNSSNLVKADIARRTHVPVSQIQDDTELSSLAIESLALVELLIDIQERHGIQLVVDDLRDLATVRDLAALVERKFGAREKTEGSSDARLC